MIGFFIISLYLKLTFRNKACHLGFYLAKFSIFSLFFIEKYTNPRPKWGRSKGIISLSPKLISFYSLLGNAFWGYKCRMRNASLSYKPEYKKRGREHLSIFHYCLEELFRNPLFLWNHGMYYFLIETAARPLRRRAWVTFLPPGVLARDRNP